jgi:lipopolysaccharide transport system permease protein
MEIELRIRPNKAIALVDFGELWRYRDLLFMLVWRDFAVKYKQTILGPIWFLLQPLLPALVFTLIFGRVAHMSTDGLPIFLFMLCNQIIWGCFSTNFTSIGTALMTNMNIFSKVYFPRLIVPLSALVSNLITLGIQLGLFAGFYVYYKFYTSDGVQLHPSLALFCLPFVILYLGAMSMGFGLWMAALTAKYRDLQQLTIVIIQLWMYGSCVIFPLSQISPEHRTLFSINPVIFATEAARYCLLGHGTLSWGTGLWSAGMTAVVLLSGLWNFNRTARTYVDIA